jgi:hypothetical protein
VKRADSENTWGDIFREGVHIVSFRPVGWDISLLVVQESSPGLLPLWQGLRKLPLLVFPTRFYWVSAGNEQWPQFFHLLQGVLYQHPSLDSSLKPPRKAKVAS